MQTQKWAKTPDLQPSPLTNHLYDWLRRYAIRKGKDASRYGAVFQLIDDFADFSNKYWKGLHELVDAAVAPDGSDAYFKYQIKRRLTDEWVQIGQALEQRDHERYDDWLAGIDHVAESMMPVNFSADEAGHVVSRMGSSAQLRYLPYSKVSVVSLPYDTYDLSTQPDYPLEVRMSLAHEIGHHVWRMIRYDEIPRRSRESSLSAQAKRFAQERAKASGVDERGSAAVGVLVSAWTSELFADVCGVFALAQSDGVPMQDGRSTVQYFIESYVKILQGQIGSSKDLLEDDGVHPFPYLRPLIRAHVARKIAPDFNAYQLLETLWEQLLKRSRWTSERTAVSFRILSAPIPDDPKAPASHRHDWEKFDTIPLETIRLAVEHVIDQVLFQRVYGLWHGERLFAPSDADGAKVFTFERWREAILSLNQAWYNQMGVKRNTEAQLTKLEDLLAPNISFGLGTDEVPRDGSGGKISHTHGNSPLHTHS